jgi:hypothetical protein
MKAASQDIAVCKSSPREVRAQMVADMASKLVKGTAKIKALPRMSKTMPSGGPSEDPKADMDITDNYEPVDYAINDSLIEKVECADQAPGVVLMSEELGERKSEDEEKGEEEDGDD